jgi:pimeloyl-ACP methyl ester carboxylesterase
MESTITIASKKYAFFIHGYPNGPNVFNEHIKQFASKGFECIALNFVAGKDITLNIKNLHETIKSYEILDNMGVRQNYNVLVGHDWGSYESWNVLYSDPTIVDLYITLSIPLNPRPLSIYEDGLVAFKSFYQLFLAFVYYISLIPVIGTLLASFLRNLFDSGLPSYNLDQQYSYPYKEYYYKYIGWFNSFRIFFPHVIQKMFSYSNPLKLKNIPVLGMRGINPKEFINDSLFWSVNEDEELKRINPNNEIVIFPNDGHYFYLTKQQETINYMLNFINKNLHPNMKKFM